MFSNKVDLMETLISWVVCTILFLLLLYSIVGTTINCEIVLISCPQGRTLSPCVQKRSVLILTLQICDQAFFFVL